LSKGRTPPGIVYAVDQRPVLGLTVLSGAQHVGLMAVNLIYPVLIVREAGGSPEVVIQVVSLSLLVLALGAVLQALPRGPVGSGYLCPPVPTAAYLAPSLLAAREGGLALVFGMTMAAGIFEALISRSFQRLRPWFPPEISGLVVLIVGMTTAGLGLRSLLAIDVPRTLDSAHAAVAVLTLGTMVALNIWTKGLTRIFCVLIGMTVGYIASALLGGFSAPNAQIPGSNILFALPRFEHPGFSFSAGLIIPFAVAAIAASLKTAANVGTCQKLNDVDWRRLELGSVSRGILADGLSTLAAGVVGTTGVNSATMNVGLANATGVLSRHVSYAAAVILLALAFSPGLGFVLYLMPPAVAGAALLFAASFIIVNGFETMTSRLLDQRKTFVIGLSFIAGLAVDFYPKAFHGMPTNLAPIISSSLVIGTVCALVLNLLFRVGIRNSASMLVDPETIDPVEIEGFMESQGAAWGARREVVNRASFNLLQSIETIVGACDPRGALTVEASFDEFNLDLRVSYEGAPLELPEKRPSTEEVIASEEGERRLAGFMLRQFADRVSVTAKGGRCTILFHFDH
jgi:xanthine permease XanP